MILKHLKTAEVLNTFFGNIVKDLEINQYSNFDPVINNVKDQTLKGILRESHPNTKTVLVFLQFNTNRRTELNLLLKK